MFVSLSSIVLCRSFPLEWFVTCSRHEWLFDKWSCVRSTSRPCYRYCCFNCDRFFSRLLYLAELSLSILGHEKRLPLSLDSDDASDESEERSLFSCNFEEMLFDGGLLFGRCKLLLFRSVVWCVSFLAMLLSIWSSMSNSLSFSTSLLLLSSFFLRIFCCCCKSFLLYHWHHSQYLDAMFHRCHYYSFCYLSNNSDRFHRIK